MTRHYRYCLTWPRSYDGQEQDEKTGVRSKCALQIQSPSMYIHTASIAIAWSQNGDDYTGKATTVNSPFTNKGREDGGESRVSASERSCIDRPGTKKQARERSQPDQVLALDYVYARFAALFLSFSLSKGTFSHMHPYERERLADRDYGFGDYKLAKIIPTRERRVLFITVLGRNLDKSQIYLPGFWQEDFDERTRRLRAINAKRDWGNFKERQREVVHIYANASFKAESTQPKCNR